MTLQFFFGSLQAGLAVGGTVFACVQAALLLTLTTTVAQLLDTFTVLVSPLRLFGANTEAIALTRASWCGRSRTSRGCWGRPSGPPAPAVSTRASRPGWCRRSCAR
jgi:hypothetical protein